MKDKAKQYNFSLRSPTGKAGFETLENKEDGLHYFLFNNDKGEPLLYGQGYANEKGVENILQSVMKNMLQADRYTKRKKRNGQAYFVLKAGNNQEIARSRDFDNQNELNSAIKMLKNYRAKSSGKPGVSQKSKVSGEKPKKANPGGLGKLINEKMPRYRYTITYYPDSNAWIVKNEFSGKSKTFRQFDATGIQAFLQEQMPELTEAFADLDRLTTTVSSGKSEPKMTVDVPAHEAAQERGVDPSVKELKVNNPQKEQKVGDKATKGATPDSEVLNIPPLSKKKKNGHAKGDSKQAARAIPLASDLASGNIREISILTQDGAKLSGSITRIARGSFSGIAINLPLGEKSSAIENFEFDARVFAKSLMKGRQIMIGRNAESLENTSIEVPVSVDTLTEGINQLILTVSLKDGRTGAKALLSGNCNVMIV